MTTQEQAKAALNVAITIGQEIKAAGKAPVSYITLAMNARGYSTEFAMAALRFLEQQNIIKLTETNEAVWIA